MHHDAASEVLPGLYDCRVGETGVVEGGVGQAVAEGEQGISLGVAVRPAMHGVVRHLANLQPKPH